METVKVYKMTIAERLANAKRVAKWRTLNPAPRRQINKKRCGNLGFGGCRGGGGPV